jgi:hypothetical protein
MTKARDLANAGTGFTTVSATELGYLDGVTSAVQTQINSKIGQATAINPTIVDAKGDIIAATGADAVSRLGVGANNTVLTADSAEATGLKWATPAASGGMTSIASGSLSGALNLTSIPGTYKDLKFIARDVSISGNTDIRFTINGRGSDYAIYWSQFQGGTVTNASTGAQSVYSLNYSTIKSGTSMSVEIDFPDYANTTTRKQFNTQMTYDNASSVKSGATTFGYYFGTGLNDAINTINFAATGQNFSTGTYILYGVN